MKQPSNISYRGLGLALLAVCLFALLSFALFNALNSRPSTPAQAPTSVSVTQPPPTLTPPPTSTPGPTPPMQIFTAEPTVIYGNLPTRVPVTPPPMPTPLTPIARATISSPPDITPFPPIVTKWVQFQGTKTGFSFLYPEGWSVEDTSGLNPSSDPGPRASILIYNYDKTKAYPRGGLPQGAMKIQLENYDFAIPSGGKPFAVGQQQIPGIQSIRDRSSGAQLLPSEERSISIFFTVGNRLWLVGGLFTPPKDVADKNTEIFYQIVGSLAYENK